MVFRVPSPPPTPGGQGPGLSAKGLARTGQTTAGRGWDPPQRQGGRKGGPRSAAPPRACSGRAPLLPRPCPAPGSWLIPATFPTSAGPAPCALRQAGRGVCSERQRTRQGESRMGTPGRRGGERKIESRTTFRFQRQPSRWSNLHTSKCPEPLTRHRWTCLSNRMITHRFQQIPGFEQSLTAAFLLSFAATPRPHAMQDVLNGEGSSSFG